MVLLKKWGINRGKGKDEDKRWVIFFGFIGKRSKIIEGRGEN